MQHNFAFTGPSIYYDVILFRNHLRSWSTRWWRGKGRRSCFRWCPPGCPNPRTRRSPPKVSWQSIPAFLGFRRLFRIFNQIKNETACIVTCLNFWNQWSFWELFIARSLKHSGKIFFYIAFNFEKKKTVFEHTIIICFTFHLFRN